MKPSFVFLAAIRRRPLPFAALLLAALLPPAGAAEKKAVPAADSIPALKISKPSQNRKPAEHFFEFLFSPVARAIGLPQNLAAPPAQQPQKQPAHSLLDKAAPGFELELLDGGKLNLAEHQGKHIVILDFWATWCPPCVAALPALSKTAEDYRSKGVRLYAVNQKESSQVIKRFLKQRKLNLIVALDAKGEVGNLYKVTGIPQTVIIGKSGQVEAVHIGYGPGSEQQWRSELDDLLAGKKE